MANAADTVTLPGKVSIRGTANDPPSELACRVLNTGELLESILQHLEAPDLLLHVPLVCKAFRSSIAASPVMQQTLFRKADWDEENRDLFFRELRIAGFEFTVELNGASYDLVGSSENHGHILSITPNKIREKVWESVALRDTLLSQPPLVRLALVDYRHEEDQLHRLTPKPNAIIVVNARGITFGQLLDVLEPYRDAGKTMFGWCHHLGQRPPETAHRALIRFTYHKNLLPDDGVTSAEDAQAIVKGMLSTE